MLPVPFSGVDWPETAEGQYEELRGERVHNVGFMN